MIANVMMPSSTATAKKSCRKPSASQRPTNGMWKSGSNSTPYASRYTVARTKKPHMVKKWAMPGIDQFSSRGLPEDLFDLGGDARAEVVLAAALVADGLARPDQLRQPQHALGGEHQDDRGHQQPKRPA